MNSSNNPQVSILMTVYNGDRHLQEAICSVLSQKYRSFEVLIVNNGSSDRTKAILEANKDSRIRVVDLPKNIGRTPALNLILNLSVGKYIAINDADDISVPSRLTEQVSYLDRNPKVGLVGSWAHIINDEGLNLRDSKPPTSHRELSAQFCKRNPLIHSSIMFRRDIAMDIGGYDEKLVYAQDFGLILDFSNQCDVAAIPDFLCLWRDSQGSETRNPAKKTQRLRDEVCLFEQIVNLKKLSLLFSLRARIQLIYCQFLLVISIASRFGRKKI